MSNESYVIKLPADEFPINKKEKPILQHLDFELTERCNNNCIHCCINLPADDRQSQKKELDTPAIKKILRESVFLGCTSLRFTGGEPLLRDDFVILYTFARKLGLRVLLFTNATLIDERIAELFSRIPPLEKIEVTMYGMKKSSYEGVTGILGSYEAARKGVNLLLKKKIPFIVKGAFLPSNKPEIEEFEAWARNIPWMDNNPPSYSMTFDLRCRRDQRKNAQIKKLRITGEEMLNIRLRRKDEYLRKMKDFCSRFMKPGGDNLFSCSSGMRGGCVDAYGYFQPCLMLRHPGTIYDLKKGSLKDALTNFFPQLRKMKAHNPDYLNRCAKCFLKGLCDQCPAKSWMEHGTLDTPVEYLCKVTHVQARFLGLLENNEQSWRVSGWEDRINKLCKK